MNVVCSISTRGRYHTTLPLTIASVINQTLLPDALVIFDDNDKPEDLRKYPLYVHLFSMLDAKQIKWQVVFGEKKGQHFNHQKANEMGYKWVWRLDDDTIAESDVLEKLYYQTINQNNVGAVGGSILTPGSIWIPSPHTHFSEMGKINNVDKEPNIQWGYLNHLPPKQSQSVDHLHCSFLYRAGIVDYNLSLSRVAHREETLFTYELKKAGYDVLVTPCVTWHARNPEGGIRDGQREMYEKDEKIFQLKDYTIVVLDCGMGDHIVFKHVLPDVKNPLVFTCYPEIIPGRGLDEAIALFGDLGPYNVYSKMDKWNWKLPLEDAFRKMYVK